MITHSHDDVSCSSVAGRGAGAGALWGAPIGVAVLFVVSAVTGELGQMLFSPIALLLGGFLGGIEGLVSGVVLAARERRRQRTDRERRFTAAASGIAGWAVVGLMTAVVGRSVTVGGILVVLVLGLIGAGAGAVLAPSVVKGCPSLGDVNRPA